MTKKGDKRERDRERTLQSISNLLELSLLSDELGLQSIQFLPGLANGLLVVLNPGKSTRTSVGVLRKKKGRVSRVERYGSSTRLKEIHSPR